MERLHVGFFSSEAQLDRSYRRDAGTWTGCDWPVRFGKLGLNLNGLKSVHARLMAGATSGEESTEWRRAAQWLARIERDAREAQREARLAFDLASQSRFHEALTHATKACQYEARYHDHLVWQALRDAIAARVHEEPADGGL